MFKKHHIVSHFVTSPFIYHTYYELWYYHFECIDRLTILKQALKYSPFQIHISSWNLCHYQWKQKKVYYVFDAYSLKQNRHVPSIYSRLTFHDFIFQLFPLFPVRMCGCMQTSCLSVKVTREVRISSSLVKSFRNDLTVSDFSCTLIDWYDKMYRCKMWSIVTVICSRMTCIHSFTVDNLSHMHDLLKTAFWIWRHKQHMHVR